LSPREAARFGSRAAQHWARGGAASAAAIALTLERRERIGERNACRAEA
jgi:hypothetical protein